MMTKFLKIAKDSVLENWVIYATTAGALIALVSMLYTEVGSIYSNISISYIAGFFVYLLTTYIPTYYKNKPFVKRTFIEMRVVYNRLISLLILMYKNVCTDKEWNAIIVKDDFDYFDDQYFSRMQQFDIKKQADTIFTDKESKQTISWLHKIEEVFSRSYDQIDNAILHYSPYLSNKLVNSLTVIRDSKFFELMLGKYGSMYPGLGAEDGYNYFDEISMVMILEGKEKFEPFFRKDKLFILRDFIECLSIFRNGLESIRVKGDIGIDKRVAYKRYIQAKTGHFNTAHL